MANRIKGEADFVVDGRTYTLCYNHAALIELEDMLDMGIVAISRELAKWTEEPDRIRLKWMRALLCAGLRKHHPKMTLDDVSELMTSAGGGADFMGAIGGAMNASFNEEGA